MLLLWGNALRRSELNHCQVKDFDKIEKRLWILGKGKQGQPTSVTLGNGTIKAIENWLEVSAYRSINDPLFCTLKKEHWRHQLRVFQE